VEYRTVSEARNMPGLRLVLTAGVPGPWSESAKSIFYSKGIPFTPVRQQMGGVNADLVAWTGIRNAPIAVHESERPRDGWLDILMLAERLVPEPRLLPSDSEDRALVVGIGNEICGEWGFGWCRRAMQVGLVQAGVASTDPNARDSAQRSGAEYGCSSAAIAASPGRVVEILTMLAKRLKAQHVAGSSYLGGRALSAADIYWACFSVLLNPMPSNVNPMSEWFRSMYIAPSEVDAGRDPILIEHREYIYKRHLKLPLDF
jgi:glutathione S-transferase